MSDFLNLATSRYSVRSFSDKQVEQEKINLILKAAQIAPTACNNQPQRIFVLKSKQSLEKLQKCKTSHFNEQLAFIITYDKTQCYIRDYDLKVSGDIDCSIVATHMILQAKELDIGSTWIMHFNPEMMKEQFDLPTNLEPVVLLVMGYESSDGQASLKHFQKKEIEQFAQEL